jgi:hypothetical protein
MVLLSTLTIGASIVACGRAPDSEGVASQSQAITEPASTAPDAGELACGPTLSCATSTQYCEHILGGRFRDNTYRCAPVPDACVSDVTCGCIDPRGLGGCSDTAGEVTVTILAP